MKLLTCSNSKLLKSREFGYLSAALHLAPSKLSGIDVCPSASPSCRRLCLNTAGMGVFKSVQEARVKKTRFLFSDRAAFMDQIKIDIRAHVKRAEKLGLRPTVRLNALSDLPFLSGEIAPLFPHVQFLDYTKIFQPKPWEREQPNYTIAFSLSELNLMDALVCLHRGMRVAVVFDVKKGEPLPKLWMDFPVVNGDEHDLLHLQPQGVVLGLRAKGKAKKDHKSGFVQIAGAKIAEAA